MVRGNCTAHGVKCEPPNDDGDDDEDDDDDDFQQIHKKRGGQTFGGFFARVLLIPEHYLWLSNDVMISGNVALV